MSKRLRTSVILSHEGEIVIFPVGDRVPAWAAKQIGDLDVYESSRREAQTPAPEPETGPETPEEAEATPSATEEVSVPENAGEDASVVVEQPSGNGSTEEWAAFAKSKGATDEDLEGMSRNEIRAKYGE